MPIKYTENYPVDWPAIALAIKDANDWRCQSCNIQCRRPNEPFQTHARALTVAHVDHDYDNLEIFVACLCSVCHLRMDASFGMAHRRRNERWRRFRAGQMAWNWGAED
jgi:hypothetical protein